MNLKLPWWASSKHCIITCNYIIKRYFASGIISTNCLNIWECFMSDWRRMILTIDHELWGDHQNPKTRTKAMIFLHFEEGVCVFPLEKKNLSTSYPKCAKLVSLLKLNKSTHAWFEHILSILSTALINAVGVVSKFIYKPGKCN